MAGIISVPSQSQNGTEEKPSENLLLQKLLEQNRLLEEDRRFLTHNCRTGSTSDSTSLHSADSQSSLRNVCPSHDHRVILSPGTRPPDSPLLHSPTEVRLKPHHLAAFESQDTESEEEGLGPSASILLDDGLDTRINYCDVLEGGGDDISQEVGLSNYGEMYIPNHEEERSDLTTTVNFSRGLGLRKESTITSTSDVTLMVQDDTEDISDQYVEERASISFRRNRSETESATGGKRISLSTIVGGSRRRTLTVIEGGTVMKEEPEIKTQEEEAPEKTAEEELWFKWSELLRNVEDSLKKKTQVIKQLARQGIPDQLRGMAWQLLSGSQDNVLKERYPALITEESPFVRAIQRDLNRTFPEHSFFKESNGLGQEGLLNILKAYSIYDREVGYCQGSPFITGLLLMKMPEEEAFCVFVKLMRDYRLRELFKPSMTDLGLCFYILEKFLEELFPDLYIHFKAVGFQTSMYASPWFLTMFASVLSLNVVFRIVDIFLLEGREIIFRVGLALMEHNKDRLLRGDMEDILKYFQKGMKSEHEVDPDALIQRALKIRLSNKKMRKMEKEYSSRKEKEAHDGKEISRLQSDNTNLAQRISALEKECASLADRLINGQVALAQGAEEMFILKKKLSVAERKLATLEKTNTDKQSNVVDMTVNNDVKHVEGAGECVREEEGGRLQPDEDCILVKTPIHVHVCREEAEQVLRQLGVGTPGTSPAVSENPDRTFSPPQSLPVSILKDEATYRESPSAGETPLGISPQEPDFIVEAVNTKGKKSKLKRRLTNKFSQKTDHDSKHKHKKSSKDEDRNDVTSPETTEVGRQSPAPSPTPPHKKTPRRKKSKSLSGDLTYELARVKLQCAETANELEGKNLELTKALHREEFVLKELTAARKVIMKLEQKLSDSKSCPQCGHNLQSNDKLNFDLTDFPLISDAPPTGNADSSILPQVEHSLTPPVNNKDSETS